MRVRARARVMTYMYVSDSNSNSSSSGSSKITVTKGDRPGKVLVRAPAATTDTGLWTPDYDYCLFVMSTSVLIVINPEDFPY